MHRSAPTDRFFTFLLSGIFLLSSVFFSPINLYAYQQDDEPVRVRLLRNVAPRTILVSSSQPANLYSGNRDTNPIAQLGSRQKLTLTTSNNQVYLRLQDGGIYARSLIIEQQPDAELTIEIAEARAIISPRTYKGSFMIQVDPSTPSTLSIINEVGLVDYVESVLASEFNFRELEASKALAVCIRTLAYRGMENQNIPEFAIPDDELWQVYQGTASITKTVKDAVVQTQGEVLRFNGDLIEAVYFASSGGHTANNEDVWNASRIQPYLRGKEDPYDFNSPNHSWESTISRDRLLRMLSDQYRVKANGIKILDRSRDGRVRTLAVTDANGREEIVMSNEFRLLVNEHFGRETLKSTLFEINVQPTMYIFSGKGYGHGVGLNQWGALQLSKKGNLYDEILAYYYNDVEIDEGGLVSSMLTASENLIDNTLIDNTGTYFSSQTDEYDPYIEASNVSGNTQSINTQPDRTNDVAGRLLGDSGEAYPDEYVGEEVKDERKAWRPFWRKRDRTKSTTTETPKKATSSTTGKRIGW